MRIVVKVGTSTLTHTSGRINIRRTEKLCKILSDVKNAGHELILVSSGAIGMGVGKLNMKSKPEDMPTKQAAAARGQCELMYLYDKLFSEYNNTLVNEKYSICYVMGKSHLVGNYNHSHTLCSQLFHNIKNLTNHFRVKC